MKPTLTLPKELVRMLNTGSWKHPGDTILSELIPFIRDPIEFRTSIDPNHRDYLLGEDQIEDEIFREYRGSSSVERSLPWRDVELSILIAINKIPGDDIAIGLDFRTSNVDSRVIANEWIDGPEQGCYWREVAPTFSDFAFRLRCKTQIQNTSQ
ncbi:MAG: hypothetical protein P1U89_18495 [Verrucomicrobiales bacterium]|nr:hypothetical protein [Verrucomicrobiales bacterium]